MKKQDLNRCKLKYKRKIKNCYCLYKQVVFYCYHMKNVHLDASKV